MTRVYDRKVPCPTCGKELDAAEHAKFGPREPESGDLTLCIGCSAWLVFLEPPDVRLLTPQEKAELTPEDRTMMIGTEQALAQARRIARAIQRAHASRFN